MWFVWVTRLPPLSQSEHHITLIPTILPINNKPHRCLISRSLRLRSLLGKCLLGKYLLMKSFAAQVLSLPLFSWWKKDGPWNFCVDYQVLNAVTIKDRFPIPIVDELLDEIARAWVLSKLDLSAGYHQICIHSLNTKKTSFHILKGHYECLVRPSGLLNAPSTFQAIMNLIFLKIMCCLSLCSYMTFLSTVPHERTTWPIYSHLLNLLS